MIANTCAKFLALFLTLLVTVPASAQDGEQLYKTACLVCHSVGGGRLVGPDLKGVTTKRSEKWLISWIKSSQTMVKKGDPDAVAIFNEFNKVPMPDQNYSDDQVRSILAFIDATEKTGIALGGAAVAQAPTGDLERGRNLFTGNIRLANGGATCISCHNVDSKDVLAGGGLAMDLTQTVSRNTAEGVKGILSGLPFPAMKQAFGNKPMTEDEINDLTAFLASVDTQDRTPAGRRYEAYMAWGGIGGSSVMLVLFSLFWIRRKRKAVNDQVFSRKGYGA